MSLISKYYEMKDQANKLSKALKELEENETLKGELQFKDELLGVINKHKRTLDDAFKVLATESPSLFSSKARSQRRSETAPRPLQSYTNPHTGEVVHTRGANHKVLREWRNQYGAETVRNWRTTNEE